MCGMRSPRYKMTASTYGECGNAWYCSFASEKIWRTGSTPVFRGLKAALKDRIERPRLMMKNGRKFNAPAILGCSLAVRH